MHWMNPRLALWAVTAVTATNTAAALQAALSLSDGPAIQIASANAPAIAHFALGHQQLIIFANLVASALLLIWWLTATAKPTHRPALRLANAAFGSWILVETVVIWTAVLGILHQVSGLPDAEPLKTALLIIRTTALKWLIPVTLCLPILQLGLGEWAYRLSARVGKTNAPLTFASKEAG
jgi:hypothetical protein